MSNAVHLRGSAMIKFPRSCATPGFTTTAALVV